MKLSNVVTPSKIAESGMQVRDVFRMCVEAGVPAVPFRRRAGQRPDAWISLHNIMKHGCIPEYMIELAEVLGNQLSCLDDTDQKVREILAKPIEPFAESPLRSVSSKAPVLKAIAILEKYAASYLFVFDGDDYKGVITPLGVAKRMLEIDREDPNAQLCENA